MQLEEVLKDKEKDGEKDGMVEKDKKEQKENE